MFVLTAEKMKAAENNAHDTRGLSFYSMMDMAGEKSAAYIAENEDASKKTVILCGKGKNGGDGLVVASSLWQKGFRDIFVILADDSIKDPLCYKMYNELLKYPVNLLSYKKNPGGCLNVIKDGEIIVDALFGIGFKGELKGNEADMVLTANFNRSAKKYALDIPSGLESDGKNTDSLHFNTDVTLTMICYKPANVLRPAANICGKTVIIHIGMQKDDIKNYAENYSAVTPEEVKTSLFGRKYDANKGDFGKVIVVAGSKTMTGCVSLCAESAVEIGAGLVTAAFPDCIYDAVTAHLTETLMMPLPTNANGRILSAAEVQLGEKLKTASAVAIGCGIGVDEDTRELTEFVIKTAKCPVVIDADGINSIAKNINILKSAKADIVLTPHPGEMARLTGKTAEEINENRMTIASEFAKEYGVTVVLKGADTIIASKDGRICVNPTGNPGMARGGSGDVLTGLIAGSIPQTDDVFSAASIAAYIHGGTGDYVASRYGILSPVPSRVVENLHNYLVTL